MGEPGKQGQLEIISWEWGRQSEEGGGSPKSKSSLQRQHATSGDKAELVRRVLAAAPSCDVKSWHVDYWALSLEGQLQLFLQALQASDLIEQTGLKFMSLGNFFTEVRSSYRDLPYHNFLHALATTHYSSKLAHTAGVNFQTTEWFALIVGAISHDIDHRGRNAAFEMATRSELAIRYNDQSPLENHHCAMAFGIALGAGECNVFETLSLEAFARVRSLMIAGILSTDMKHHGEHVKHLKAFTLKEGNTSETGQGQFLVETFLHSADISNPFMPPDMSSRWGEAIAAEMTLQVEDERRLGIPVTSFMDGLTTPVARARSQAGFMDFVVFPLLDSLCSVFTGLHESRAFFDENRGIIRSIVESDAGEKSATAT